MLHKKLKFMYLNSKYGFLLNLPGGYLNGLLISNKRRMKMNDTTEQNKKIIATSSFDQ